MSSTDAKRGDGPLREFFFRRALPRDAARREKGEAFFPRHPDPAATSYFLPRGKRTVEPRYLEAPECPDGEALEARLYQMWTAQGHPELAELAGDVARLAVELARTEEPGEEVSPFIYVMF